MNASLDRLRRRSIRSSVPLPDDDALGKAATTAAPVGRGGVPRDPIATRETQLVIARALAELPESQREAIVLVDVEGYSVEEAAALLIVRPGRSRAGVLAAELVGGVPRIPAGFHGSGRQSRAGGTEPPPSATRRTWWRGFEPGLRQQRNRGFDGR